MSKWNKVSDMKRLSRMVMPLDAIEGLPDNHVISVTERTIEIDEYELVQNNVSTDTYTLELDAEWDDITPVVIFSNSQGDYQVAYENGPTKIPAAVMAVIGSVDVSVFGLDSTGAVRVVTKAAPNTMTVVESGKFVGEVSEDDISLLGQLLAAAEAANEAATNANATIIKSAVATTLEPGEPATANIADNVLTIGVPKGEKGDKGDQGDPGQDGTNGTDGVTPFTQATVTTLEPDSPATVAIEENTLKLGIPKGAKGDKGDTGDQGPQGEPGQDGQDATLPEGMVTADETGVLSRLGETGEPEILGDVSVGNVDTTNSISMRTSSNSPVVLVSNDASGKAICIGLIGGKPAFGVLKSQSDDKVYSFSPVIPEDDTLTVVTSDAYKADTDPLKQRIAELEQQAQNVLVGTATGYVAHAEDAYAAKPREVRIKGRTVNNLWPAVESVTDNGITATMDETGLITLSGTATADSSLIFGDVGMVDGRSYTVNVSQKVSGVRLFVNRYDADGDPVSPRAINIDLTTTITTNVADVGDVARTRAFLFVATGTTVNASFRIMLVEGTEPPDCFTPTGVHGVEPEKLVVAGKNLLDYTKLMAKWFGAGNFAPGAYTMQLKSLQDWWTENAGNTYSLYWYLFKVAAAAAAAGAAGGVSRGYIESGSARFAGASVGSVSSTTINLDYAGYLLFIYYGANEFVGTFVDDVQIELGSTATAYEPPNVTEVALPETDPLMSIGDFADELVIEEDGSARVERELQTYVLDGTESWLFSSAFIPPATSGFFVCVLGDAVGLSTNGSDWVGTCDHFEFLNPYNNDGDCVFVYPQITSSGYKVTCRLRYEAANGDVSALASWIAANPTIVVATTTTTTTVETLSSVQLPRLPAPTFNAYPAGGYVPPETSVGYERDINIVLANLEAVQTALLGGE